MVNKQFRVDLKIGEGNNGQVYGGTDIHTGEKVALKLEPLRKASEHLTNEYEFYQQLRGQGGSGDLFNPHSFMTDYFYLIAYPKWASQI